ncbi:uncharacterized protein LOC110840128 [Zootermopsis nevadensis]|uniref:Uncharacterized protein n=1 Tax=Zootermopsis nevadensis TaxID=136037 RepID=A0A067QR72_ZOONE|nr:uncharacterized protein LOC110840128 [Zootermopsis nevadensis]KDR07521.1 hypothetical protein L798_02990 [Zootermopsis nevadensis]
MSNYKSKARREPPPRYEPKSNNGVNGNGEDSRMYRENNGGSVNFKTNSTKRNSTKSGTQGARFGSPYSQRSSRMASSATRPITTNHPSENEDDSEHNNLEAQFATTKNQFDSLQTDLLKKLVRISKQMLIFHITHSLY